MLLQEAQLISLVQQARFAQNHFFCLSLVLYFVSRYLLVFLRKKSCNTWCPNKDMTEPKESMVEVPLLL